MTVTRLFFSIKTEMDVDFFDMETKLFSLLDCFCWDFISTICVCMCFRLNTSECFTLGDVTTVNMTMVNGGVAYNVIPAEMDVSFDLRIPPTVNLQVRYPWISQSSCSAGSSLLFTMFAIPPCKFSSTGRWCLFEIKSMLTSEWSKPYQEFEGQIQKWCKEAGEDITYEFAQVGARSLREVPFVPPENEA